MQAPPTSSAAHTTLHRCVSGNPQQKQLLIAVTVGREDDAVAAGAPARPAPGLSGQANCVATGCRHDGQLVTCVFAAVAGKHDTPPVDTGRPIGIPYPVEWVTIDETDHEDDTDDRRERARGFTPVRFQAQDKGAAVFNRQEGMWVGGGKIYFDCSEGGAQNLGQIWEYDTARETLTLIYESTNPSLRSRSGWATAPATCRSGSSRGAAIKAAPRLYVGRARTHAGASFPAGRQR